MKTIITLCLLIILTKGLFASHKILDSRKNEAQTEVLCGETDSIVILMDPSLLYLNRAIVEIKSATNLTATGFFWNTSMYSLPTNGDLTVRIVKIPVLSVMLPLLVLSLVVFIPIYFLRNRSLRKARFIKWAIIIGTCCFWWPFTILLDNFNGGLYFELLVLLPFLTGWLMAWLSKKIYKKYSNLFFQFVRKIKRDKLAL
jgi:hypothetical protein